MSLSDLEKQIISLDPANIGRKFAKIMATALENRRMKIVKGPCDHEGYNFKQHGRRCPHCSEFLTDFGD